MLSKGLVPLLAGLCIGGCSIRPLPENVTRDTTAAIVQKIRCEAREALDYINAETLRAHARNGDPFTIQLADGLEAGTVTPIDLLHLRHKIKLDDEGLKLYKTYTLSAVTFDFQFAMSELNDAAADVGFRLPLAEGLFTLGLNAGAKFDRKNTRKFQITSSFLELHHLDRQKCEEIVARTENFIYPITGLIGLYEVFNTFVKIDSTAGPGSDAAHRFSDTVTFTTTLTAGATPKLALDPIPARRFRVASASATLKAARVDEHQVAIAIARGDEVASFDPRVLSGKAKSKIIADELRIENLLDVQRRNTVFIGDLLR